MSGLTCVNSLITDVNASGLRFCDAESSTLHEEMTE